MLKEKEIHLNSKTTNKYSNKAVFMSVQACIIMQYYPHSQLYNPIDIMHFKFCYTLDSVH